MTLEQVDGEIASLVAEEMKRRGETIQLIAAENVTRNAVLAPLASIFVSKTAEGIPGARYHSGCSVVDRLETLAQQRAQQLFNARRAWVQPLSGSLANLIVLTSL